MNAPADSQAPPAPFRPSIKDVARVAGVHFTTVSLALRGHPRIPLETRNRILAIAARVGYRRDDVASALVRHRSNSRVSPQAPVMAYIVNRSPAENLYKTAHQRRMIGGARRQAAAMGYDFELAVVAAGAHTSSSLRRHLRKLGVRGMIIGAFGPGEPDPELDARGLFVVKIDSQHVRPAATLVSNDQMYQVRLAFREMRARGYRRVGLAVGELDERNSDGQHLSAWCLEQSRIAEADRVAPLLFPFQTEGARVATALLRDWIKREAVDAVLCNWVNIARMVRDAGFQMPGQVGCACLSLSQPTAHLAGIVADHELVGRRAASLLENLMRSESPHPSEAPAATYIRGRWHDGASAPPRD